MMLPNADRAGVVVSDGGTRQVVRMMRRRGVEAEFARQFQDRFALALPHGPMRLYANGLAVVGVAPGNWLVMDAISESRLIMRLQSSFESASFCDLSDAYVFLRVTGSKARNTLAKLAPVDLHARQFPEGCAASTNAAHVAVMLWRLPDEAVGPAFELGVPRSYARYLHEVLMHAGAEFQARD